LPLNNLNQDISDFLSEVKVTKIAEILKIIPFKDDQNVKDIGIKSSNQVKQPLIKALKQR